MYELLKRIFPKRLWQRLPERHRNAIRSRLNHRALVLRAVESNTSDLQMLREQLSRVETLTQDLNVMNARLVESNTSDLQMLSERVSRVETVTQDLNVMNARLLELRQIVGAQLDRIPELRQQLLSVRNTEEYLRAAQEPEPLVSVRIATYNHRQLLFERALPSVFQQTHTNFEIIVVGDGCDDDTAERFRDLGDPRVRFVNLPHRGVYPETPKQRWMVAGTPAMNLGAQMARGQWIAPLDDDDEFAPNHIELLLATALQGQYEMVYGKLRAVHPPPAEPKEVGVYPPIHGEFGFQGAMYMSALRFFEYEPRAWTLDEPGDWNLGRRMLEAGVRIGWVPQVVTTIFPAGPTP